MPPANSRNPSPPDSAHTPSFFSALRELESPVNQDVLNLAATLTTQADEGDDDHDAPGLRALRLSASSTAAMDHDQLRLDRSRDRLRLLERQRDELDHRDRLRRVMNRLGRIHDPSTAYGDRIPSANNLYDWSPANEADDEDEVDNILAELRRQQPNADSDILRFLSRSQLEQTRNYIRGLRASNPTSVSNSSSQQQQSPPQQPPSAPAERDGSTSLRSAAILQSVRRHPRFSARTREYLQRYNSDRDSASRSSSNAEPRERYSFETVRQSAMQRFAEGRPSIDRERRDLLARADSYRRGFLDRPSNAASSSAPVSPLLEQTIKYLSQIRHSNTIDDSLKCALDVGFLSKNYFCDAHTDFVLDTLTLPPPAETSWLAPGAVLSGCQHATTVASTITTTAPGSSTTLYRFRNNETMTSTLLDPPHRPWLAQSYSTPRSRSSQLAPEVVTTHSPQQDRWPVKVTIHAVDYSKMSLSATMEAYNVPSHPHAHQSLLSTSLDGSSSSPFTRTSSITTYLEGEILDFNTHTLLTESFKSSAHNDATYWRKLPPFQKLTDDEIVGKLLSRRWFEEELNKDWILMRWKERCFVKSLNRSTADPVQPPATSTTTTFAPDMLLPASSSANNSFHSSSTRENHYDPSRERDGWGNGDMEHTSFDDSGCGLTISGFYYVCLRRSDGKLEGLYYDPQSSPYQCLKLDSVRGGVFPAWGFR